MDAQFGYVDFGRTGLRVSRLCIGTGTHGFGGRSDQTALGLEGLAGLLRLAYDRGVTFWDTADGYGSHPHVARALQGLPRDRVVIATKTMSRSARDVTQDVERFLRELKTDVLDIVLMHYLSQRDWLTRYADAAEALCQAKAEGQVRAVGVSCHDLGALKAAAEAPWVDVILVRINHAGVNMDAEPARVVPVIEQMYDSGKAVYAMKVLGCGRLVRDVHGAIEYVLRLGAVHAINIGVTRREHLEQNLKALEDLAPRYPLRPLGEP